MVSPSPLASDLLESIPHLRAFARYVVKDEELADRLVENVLVRAWNDGPGLCGRRLTIRLFGLLHHELRSCPGARGATASLGSHSSRRGSGARAGLLRELPSHGRNCVDLGPAVFRPRRPRRFAAANSLRSAHAWRRPLSSS